MVSTPYHADKRISLTPFSYYSDAKYRIVSTNQYTHLPSTSKPLPPSPYHPPTHPSISSVQTAPPLLQRPSGPPFTRPLTVSSTSIRRLNESHLTPHRTPHRQPHPRCPSACSCTTYLPERAPPHVRTAQERLRRNEKARKDNDSDGTWSIYLHGAGAWASGAMRK